MCVCKRPHVQFSLGTCVPTQEERTSSAFSVSRRPGIRAPRWLRPALRARPRTRPDVRMRLGPPPSRTTARPPGARVRAPLPFHPIHSSPRPRPTFLSPNPAACLVPGDQSPSSGFPGVPSGPAFHSGGPPAGAGAAAALAATATSRPADTRAPAPALHRRQTARALPGGCPPPARVGPGLAPPPPPRARSSSKGGKKRGKK